MDKVGKDLKQALRTSRIAIENVTPCVDNGRFPARSIVGRPVSVQADIFADGHNDIMAQLLWRHGEERRWRVIPLTLLGNDRWEAQFTPDRTGLHYFLIEARIDLWNTYRSELEKKSTAGAPIHLEVEEGRRMVAAALDRTDGRVRTALQKFYDRIHDLDDRAAAEKLLSTPIQLLMQKLCLADYPARLEQALAVVVERIEAGFASWYELFPRSQSTDPQTHGHFDDVIARLPAIQAMGFDVLYFPPIHPIGKTHRKGPNNSLIAEEDDPGSPYAIGGQEGGHTAIHPQLGTLDDFRRLVNVAADYGLQIALDFAIQCSPDHPWISAHPEWFQWRPDGSIRYAENPPKKYEDIVNVNFYAEQGQAQLWQALRDIIEFWIDEGVRIFRVDNPHTKPLPFWSWLIRDIQSRHPQTLFLSEAFTRPAMMYRLAKLGFSQSYTYFTWRTGKQELTDYMLELTQQAPRDYFRPHFFVNTPDINPFFLQTSGRPGFLIRAALASTMSGLWGMYSGFELCEAEAIPGKEEYWYSEKYQIKPRDWNAEGNIIREISRLNHLRREYPQLQDHLNIRFLPAWNDQVICFSKRMAGEKALLLVAISLDPFSAQEAHFEIPLDELGVSETDSVLAEELMMPQKLIWKGRVQHWYFNPDHMPFAIWHLRPA